MLKKIIFFFLQALFFTTLYAQVELKTALNKNRFIQGDTLISECIFNYNDIAYAASTLHVWIENKSGTKRWKYRYPLVNGKCLFNLILDKNLSSDTYAINYLVQPQFFNIKARVRNYSKAMDGINLLVISKNTANYTNTFTPDSSGNFKTGRILFSDTAQFTFTPNNKKGGELWMNIETPLDSSFTALTRQTVMISVGNTEISTAENYKFDSLNFINTGKELSEIIVEADVKKKKLRDFQKQNVSTLFKAISKDFNGFYNEEMMRSMDIFAYLQTQLTGLEITKRGTWYSILRAGAFVDIFIDEMRTTTNELLALHPGDVALVKIFDPGSGPTLSYGGALAIYTKRGEDLQAALKQRSVYQVFGYSEPIEVWK